MYRHSYPKRVRYGETDQMGYLYYGHYPMLYEIGRVEAIRDLGVSYKYIEDELGLIMPVISVEAKYFKPAKYDEVIRIDTILQEMPGRIIVFHFELFNEANDLLHTAVVKLVFVDQKTNKMVRTPDYLTDKLKSYFEK
ncbi:MAG: acyl-CoA thioesterase [Saprospiraceae bacterium]|nr:acyl-CoA thioesterase [Saprospiraceae bacterium]MBK8632922.1 acyl-CoA thioesterase [Saprospiraceae bacterium]MBP7642275.1 acyl-CoA thioesterase [Saprospiraceae bacterium]HMS67469.1 thioesterase family protein [Saprospiraceae bacterium]